MEEKELKKTNKNWYMVITIFDERNIFMWSNWCQCFGTILNGNIQYNFKAELLRVNGKGEEGHFSVIVKTMPYRAEV